jgi:hypothetical protein
MPTTTNQPPATIRAWLAQRGVTDLPEHHVARALGVKRSEVETLLSAAPTAQALLNLNRLAQVKHMALANRVWPNCTWLAWENRHNAQQPPVIDLIRRVFGYELLKAVEKTFGDEVVYQYWSDLDVPSEYDDITLDDDALDPLEDVPEDQIVDNPHLDIEVEIGEGFVFGSAETAACFRWLIESRHNYSHYVDNRTSYTNDPFGVQLAYDLRRSLKEGYWAALPPDTLPAWLAIAQALKVATVPEEYQEGSLPTLYTTQAATLPTNLLHIVQLGGDEIWLRGCDALIFDRQPVHVFVLESDTGQAPAALILTTQSEPGNPERHRANPPFRYLHRGNETDQLAFVPRDQMERIVEDINEAESVMFDTLDGANYGLHAETGIFCVWRYNPCVPGSSYGEPIPVYGIPDGYMLQLDPEYCFTPLEMAID